MRWRIPIVLILALFVAVSCDQQPTDPVEQPVATAPAFNFGNGPQESGVVIRSGDEGYLVDLFWETPADPWIIWLGLEPGEVPSWCVGDDESPNAESLWALARRGEKSNEVWKMNKAPVTVFDLQEHWDYFDEGLGLGENPYCYAVMRAAPIGGGEGNYRETWKLDYGNDGFNAHFNGTVEYMGETYRLKWMLKNAIGNPDVHVARVH
jgi:hypothetical protein